MGCKYAFEHRALVHVFCWMLDWMALNYSAVDGMHVVLLSIGLGCNLCCFG